MSDLDDLESIADANDLHVNERDRSGRGSKQLRIGKMDRGALSIRSKIKLAQASSAAAAKRRKEKST